MLGNFCETRYCIKRQFIRPWVVKNLFFLQGFRNEKKHLSMLAKSSTEMWNYEKNTF